MTTTERHLRPVHVVIPAYGRADLVDLVLDDLAGDTSTLASQVTVVDNLGDYSSTRPDVRVVRTGLNLRWIGTVNWALHAAADDGAAVCVVLNSDVRLSRPFLDGLVNAVTDDERVAIAAPCYDDYWPHQHAPEIPAVASAYKLRPAVHRVPFCDGAAIAFDVAAVAQIGTLDVSTFDWHGYGADIDIAIRARRAGFDVVVTESCYVSHSRHGSMPQPGVDVRRPREEIERGMTAKYGQGWRHLAGLPDSSLRPELLRPEKSDAERDVADRDVADRELVEGWRDVLGGSATS